MASTPRRSVRSAAGEFGLGELARGHRALAAANRRRARERRGIDRFHRDELLDCATAADEVALELARGIDPRATSQHTKSHGEASSD